jgi:hypothetical protein
MAVFVHEKLLERVAMEKSFSDAGGAGLNGPFW